MFWVFLKIFLKLQSLWKEQGTEELFIVFIVHLEYKR